jgi:hypothetical protein
MPLLEFSGALFHSTPFWLFPGPETDGIWLFMVKKDFFIFFVQNKIGNLKRGLQREDQFLNNDQFTK